MVDQKWIRIHGLYWCLDRKKVFSPGNHRTFLDPSDAFNRDFLKKMPTTPIKERTMKKKKHQPHIFV